MSVREAHLDEAREGLVVDPSNRPDGKKHHNGIFHHDPSDSGNFGSLSASCLQSPWPCDDTAEMSELSAAMAALESSLLVQGLDLRDVFKPGLSADELKDQLEAAGVGADPEAMEWWTWQNGEVEQEAAAPHGWVCSLEQALTERAWRLAKALEWQEPGIRSPEQMWSPAWLPIVGTFHGAVTALQTSDVGPRLVVHVDWSWPETFIVAAPSMAAYLGLWSAAIDTGAYSWDRGAHKWSHDFDKLTIEMRQAGL